MEITIEGDSKEIAALLKTEQLKPKTKIEYKIVIDNRSFEELAALIEKIKALHTDDELSIKLS